jgi:hypothetical protein
MPLTEGNSFALLLVQGGEDVEHPPTYNIVGHDWQTAPQSTHDGHYKVLLMWESDVAGAAHDIMECCDIPGASDNAC